MSSTDQTSPQAVSTDFALSHGPQSRVMDASPSNPSSSPLLNMPLEIFLLICESLPSWGRFSNMACLALSNRSLYERLKSSARRVTKTFNKYDRIVFLFTLAKDLPRDFACQHCGWLHFVRAEITSAMSTSDVYRVRLPCFDRFSIELDYADVWLYDSSFRIAYHHVQLAMKRHLYGPQYGISLEAFRLTSFKGNTGATPQPRNLLSVEARILENRLVMRSQHIILFQSHERSIYRKYFDNICCIHDREFRVPYCHRPQARRSGILKSSQAKESEMPKWVQCGTCCSDFHMENIDLENDWVVTAVTRWSGLGCGRDPDIDDEWRSHRFSRPDQNTSLLYEDNPPDVKLHELNTIRNGFELQPGTTLAGFTIANIKTLFKAPFAEDSGNIRFERGLTWRRRRAGWQYSSYSDWWLLNEEKSVDEVCSKREGSGNCDCSSCDSRLSAKVRMEIGRKFRFLVADSAILEG